MIALSTLSILSIVMCFNAVLFLSLGLYLFLLPTKVAIAGSVPSGGGGA